MLRLKSVAILKANLGILKHGDGRKMWMWLCVERESYLGFASRMGMWKIGKNIVKQKRAKRVLYMAMDQKAQEAVRRVWEKKDIVGVTVTILI